MPDCYLLTKSIAPDCDNPIVQGVDAKIWVFPLSVWKNAAFTYDATNSNIIDGIVPASGETGAYITGKFQSVEGSTTQAVAPYGTNWVHQVTLRVLNNSPEVKEELESLAGGKFVIVVQNNYKGASDKVAFEVYGNVSGLRSTEGGRETNNADTLGGYTFILATEEGTTEPRLPMSVLDTDYSTTKALLDSIVTATLAA